MNTKGGSGGRWSVVDLQGRYRFVTTIDTNKLLMRYAANLEQIRQLPSIVPVDKIDEPPAPGEWTARQLIMHLADLELIGGVRLRRVLAEDRPRLPRYDETTWSARLDYERSSPEEAIPLMVALRLWAISRLRRATPAEWQRTCIDEAQDGRELTLAELLSTYVDHVDRHVQQLERIAAIIRTDYESPTTDH
jgi:hypothetical protein